MGSASFVQRLVQETTGTSAWGYMGRRPPPSFSDRARRILDAPEFEASGAHSTGSTSDGDVSGGGDRRAEHRRLEERPRSRRTPPTWPPVTVARGGVEHMCRVRPARLPYPSANPFADLPATPQPRLTNMASSRTWPTPPDHNAKLGGEISVTKVHEDFTFGITDPTRIRRLRTKADEVRALRFDVPRACCSRATNRSPSSNRASTCRTTSRRAMRRSRRVFASITTTGPTRRDDPRLGVSYAVPGSGTVLRASYWTLQTRPPLLSWHGSCSLAAAPPRRPATTSSGGSRGLAVDRPANTGYFDKRTDNGYDFGGAAQHADRVPITSRYMNRRMKASRPGQRTRRARGASGFGLIG